MVKTKSVRDAIETSDGKRILVMRFWPRARTKEKLRLHSWNRNLVPDEKLHRDWYDKIISWDQYVLRFLKLMEGQNDSVQN